MKTNKKLFLVLISVVSLLITSCGSRDIDSRVCSNCDDDYFQQVVSSENEDVSLVVTIPDATTLTQEGTAAAHTVWLEMIREANVTIELGHFYLSNKEGSRLEEVIQEVIKAAERGVKIRILTDIVMKSVSQDTIERFEKIPGIEVRIFNWKELTGGILHAKYMIVDDKDVFIGSQNFDWRAIEQIHETGVRIKSSNFASAVLDIFNLDWAFMGGDVNAYRSIATGPIFHFKNDLYLISSPKAYNPRGVKNAVTELLQLINEAKEKITVQLLHYSLKRSGTEMLFKDIDDALRRAAARGVNVKMLISDWSKRKPNVDFLKDLNKVENITIKFVTIPEHPSGFQPYSRVIHSKVFRMDNMVSWVGTSNWEYGYFHGSRNLEVVIKRKPIAEKLDALFNALWNSSYAYEIDPNADYVPPETHTLDLID